MAHSERINAAMINNPLTYLAECAAGTHSWQETIQAGISTCTTCGSLAYCLSCSYPIIPPGSIIRSCRYHRHTGTKLADCTRPLTAVSALRRQR